jgi:hypothetical protein
MDKLQNKAYDEQEKCIAEGIVKSSHNHELNSLKYQKESLKERYRQIKNEKGLNKQQLEAFIDEDINLGMIVWKDKFTLFMPQEHATIFGQIWSKISKESTTSDFVYQTMQDAKQELLLEYPRRRTDRPTVIPGLESLPRQSIIPRQQQPSWLITMKSMPIDICKGKQKKTLFDLDEGAPTIARTLSVFSSNVITEKPVDIILDSPEAADITLVAKQDKIIAAYIQENRELNFCNRAIIRQSAEYNELRFRMESVDIKYARMLVMAANPDMVDPVELYWAIEAQKEYLRSLLK